MTYALWFLQTVLALLFLFAGGLKLVVPVEALGMPFLLPAVFVRSWTDHHHGWRDDVHTAGSDPVGCCPGGCRIACSMCGLWPLACGSIADLVKAPRSSAHALTKT